MRITLLSAALLATSLAHSAVAIDGWYTTVFGGYTFVPDNVDNSLLGLVINHAAFENGYNVGGSIGYKSNPLRYEAEYTFINASAKAFRVNHIPQFDVSGYASANLIMANVFYDTPEMLPALTPYLGLGIGYAYIQDSLSGLRSQGPVYFSARTSSFAYQGMLGITYNFAEQYAAYLGYRYVATSSADTLGHIFQAHNATAGAVYRFDNGAYK